MELQFYGANCFGITTKQAHLIIDDNLADLDAKGVIKAGDIVLFTGPHGLPDVAVKLLIDCPGEYEVSGVNIEAVAMRAHMDGPGEHSATLYKIEAEELNIVVTGHIFAEISDAQLETLGTVDVLCIPIGNSGYTLDGIAALEMIKKIEPKLIVPSHYDDKSLHYPVPQTSLEDGLKAIGMEPTSTLAKLKLKASDLTDTTQLLILEKQ